LGEGKGLGLEAFEEANGEGESAGQMGEGDGAKAEGSEKSTKPLRPPILTHAGAPRPPMRGLTNRLVSLMLNCEEIEQKFWG